MSQEIWTFLLGSGTTELGLGSGLNTFCSRFLA